MPSFIETIKKAALEAVEASKPCAVVFGTVASITPLKINVEQKLFLSDLQLIKTAAVSGALQIGDKVLLLRVQGGQKYVIWDKVIL